MTTIPVRFIQPLVPEAGGAVGPWEPQRELRVTAFSEGAGGVVPEFEAWETPRAYRLRALLPGVSHGDLTIAIAWPRLIITGSTPQRGAGRGASFRRSYLLPGAADAAHARAGLRAGVLSIVVPKDSKTPK